MGQAVLTFDLFKVTILALVSRMIVLESFGGIDIEKLFRGNTLAPTL
jgi:hypothetical protein